MDRLASEGLLLIKAPSLGPQKNVCAFPSKVICGGFSSLSCFYFSVKRLFMQFAWIQNICYSVSSIWGISVGVVVPLHVGCCWYCMRECLRGQRAKKMIGMGYAGTGSQCQCAGDGREYCACIPHLSFSTPFSTNFLGKKSHIERGLKEVLDPTCCPPLDFPTSLPPLHVTLTCPVKGDRVL